MSLKKLLGGKSRMLVGVDVGSSSVKVAALKRNGADSYQLEAIGIEPVPQDCIVDGVIISKIPVADAINKIFQSANLRNCRVATSISGHSVIVKKVTLPAQTDAELDESIRWEAEQYIPFEISDVNLDYQVTRRHPEGNKIDVILVAAKRDKITDQTSVLSMAGLEPVVVDIDSFALQNVYEVNYRPEPNVVAALLNIGAGTLNVNIVKGREFLFTRDIAMGGNHYNDFLQKELNISYEEAEKYKRGDTPTEETKSRTMKIVESVSENLVLEVQKTLDYFKTTTHSEDVSEMYISGGGCRIAGLRDFFQEKFQVPVTFLDPFKQIRILSQPGFLESPASDFAVAVGLALRSAGDR